jgi:hypothetical protein
MQGPVFNIKFISMSNKLESEIQGHLQASYCIRKNKKQTQDSYSKV